MKIINKCVTNRKTAVVTGASSGIGLEAAKLLAADNYHIIAVGRNEEALSALVSELGKKRVTAVTADLCDIKECVKLYTFSRAYSTELLINSAGMGVYGEFDRTSIKKDMDMLDLNVRAAHVLTKLFVREFLKKNHGYIVNVASAAGFMPGPFMSGYYAGKSYIVSLSAAINAEIRRKHKNVHISVFCPGPVATAFNARAGVSGSIKGITAEEAAKYLVTDMRENRFMIIPTFSMKLICAFGGALPKEFTAAVNYFVQKTKKKISD